MRPWTCATSGRGESEVRLHHHHHHHQRLVSCPQACKQEMWTGSWWMWGERGRRRRKCLSSFQYFLRRAGGRRKQKRGKAGREREESWVNAVKLVLFSKAFIPVLLRKHGLGHVPKYSCAFRPETKTSKLWSAEREEWSAQQKQSRHFSPN